MRIAAQASGVVAALLAVVFLALGAPAARAGVWAQVACVNPNGTAAPSAGWSAFAAGSGPGASANAACAPGTPMSAALSAALPAPVFTAAGLMYTPPPNSTLVGGSMQVLLSAEGGGTSAVADAEIDEPAQTSADARRRCAPGSRSCATTSATEYSGTFTVPANLGGDLYVTAGCAGTGGFTCDSGARSGTWALAQVSSAVLLLQNTASPSARTLGGSLLARVVHGRARLRLAASDPGGPGLYRVAATIDGRTVHNAIPSRNGGSCVSVGTQPVTGALEFDASQPCPTALTVSLRVPTARLSDSTHRLIVTLTDAAGNTSTVLRRTITTDNPQLTPRPAHGLRARFALGWSWSRTETVLRSISAVGLPRPATIRLSCTGTHCPSLPSRPVARAGRQGFLRRLRGLRLHPGDTLLLTVAAPHRRPERIRLAIHRDARPQAVLLTR